MPVEIDAFLAAYQPKFICIACLGAVTARDEADVRRTVEMLLAERRVETQVAECLNCQPDGVRRTPAGAVASPTLHVDS
jgi:hypothetical protein